jgi:hypothetical protein
LWRNGYPGISNVAYRFFTHLAIALSGKEPSDLVRRKVFQRVMFYNYVQAVISGSRIAPTSKEFAESESAFRAVIEQFRPTHIVACGKRLWDNMPYFDEAEKKGKWVNLEDDQKFYVGHYRTNNASPLCMCMIHPQSGRFNGRSWYPRIQAFLQMT